MLLFILSFLGGVLTILSPCILPILPFVFAKSDRPFIKSGLPLLIGLILSFTLVSSLAAVGGEWVQSANGIGRVIALIVFAVFGLMLLSPRISEFITSPIVALGSRINNKASDGFMGSIGLGVATGLLWAPCAGPILGLILTGAAINGASAKTFGLLIAYALGAGVSLSLAIIIGGKVFAAMKQSLGIGESIRKALGGLILIGVALIATGLDTGLLTKVSLANTNKIETALVEKLNPQEKVKHGQMPELLASSWINSSGIKTADLKGKVVLIDFWTYSCINCLRALPYVKSWHEKYKDAGLVVIGVHAPEFAFERKFSNVEKAVKDLGINYPVALDNDYEIWNAFSNQFWPAHYFIDRNGKIRAHHFGEGEYERSEKIIQMLLKENGVNANPKDIAPETIGVGQQALKSEKRSPETYLGYDRSEGMDSPQTIQKGIAFDYTKGSNLLDRHSLIGNWTIYHENILLNKPNGKIYYRFKARDVHLVLGSNIEGKKIKFRVLLDGKPPLTNKGMDIDENGYGEITTERLYQLIRIKNNPEEHDFEIEFFDSDVNAYAFTFG